MNGLGGCDGSILNGDITFYFAVGVYSKGANGIDAFGTPGKNVVATFITNFAKFVPIAMWKMPTETTTFLSLGGIRSKVRSVGICQF